jgi:uncharacterized protein (DUF433 family)
MHIQECTMHNSVATHLLMVLSETMITRSAKLPITVDREVMSGAPVFEGTRVPVSALFENLEAGVSLDEFIENFPTVSREQAIAVLEHSRGSIEELSLAP